MSMRRGFSKMIPCLKIFQSRFMSLASRESRAAVRSSQAAPESTAALTMAVMAFEVMVEAVIASTSCFTIEGVGERLVRLNWPVKVNFSDLVDEVVRRWSR